MMESSISIVYIDDISDEILSLYMSKKYCSIPFYRFTAAPEIKKEYKEVRFRGDEGYEKLLQNTTIKSANVILIDNHLFEERTAGASRFSGKQFKVILRKLLPYVEVIIITQDETLTGENVIRKFSGRHGEDANQYYQENLAPLLDNAIKEIIDFEELANDLKQSSDVEKLLVDKILNSLHGDDSYDELTKSDIDSLISSFKELKDVYGEK